MDLEEEINKLQKEKQDCLQAITAIKHKVSELDCQKNEALNEVYYRTKLLTPKLLVCVFLYFSCIFIILKKSIF